MSTPPRVLRRLLFSTALLFLPCGMSFVGCGGGPDEGAVIEQEQEEIVQPEGY